MDHKLTESIQAWLEQRAAERNIPLGAGMLLRLNRNRILYHNILRKPEKMAAKLEYELKKFLKIRLERLTLEDVQRMDKEVTARAAQSLAGGFPLEKSEEPDAEDKAPHIGRRADHEQLPEDIRALYDKNGEVYAKLRQCFYTLKGMANAAPCDRYEYLKVLDGLDKAYRANWQEYDAYVPPTNKGDKGEEDNAEETSEEAEEEASAPQLTAKEVAAARKFISTGKKKLAAKPYNDDLRKGMQHRINIILASGGDFKPDYLAELKNLGFNF